MAFFTIFSPQGDSPAKVQHDTHPAAMRAAHQMAERNPGNEFFVMRSTSKPIVAGAPTDGEREIELGLDRQRGEG